MYIRVYILVYVCVYGCVCAGVGFFLSRGTKGRIARAAGDFFLFFEVMVIWVFSGSQVVIGQC